MVPALRMVETVRCVSERCWQLDKLTIPEIKEF